MDRCAVFVDAGYFFAQGSVALAGERLARVDMVLDASRAASALKDMAAAKAPGTQLLRIYWYDGAIGGIRPTSDQAQVADLDDVKLRLGFINSAGQQKGVDSLIVTDLIELARLKSICDAVLVTGDEDIRIGVQIAQNYGVRIHLLGIASAHRSQSPQLLQEADTTTEWTRDEVSQFLSVRPKSRDAAATSEDGRRGSAPAADRPASEIEIIVAAVGAFVSQLASSEVSGVQAYWETDRGVPADLDKKLLGVCSAAIGRRLEAHEMKRMRAEFQQIVKQKVSQITVADAALSSRTTGTSGAE